jgi:hypothetical protein
MTWLAALKGYYDPDNIFHLNHNIPAGQPTTGRRRHQHPLADARHVGRKPRIG